MLTVGSLFAGIGGFDLGLARAGMRTVWQVELNPFCRSVLECHFPDAERHEDVRAVGAHNLQPVDVICGGFPCQDLSVAGRGAGLDGERSGLWSEYARLVGDLRPRYVVVENVPALLGRGLGSVLGDLAALGYDAEWDCIPAAAVGAPHLRDRFWLVAYPGGAGSGPIAGGASRDEGPHEGRATQDDHEPRGHGAGGRAGTLADAACLGRRPRREGRPAGGGGWSAELPHGPRVFGRRPQPRGWTAEPDVARMAHGVPRGVDRGRALGNALVPQIAEWIGHRIVEWEQGRMTEREAA